MKKITTVILACVVTLIGAGLDARGDVIVPDLKKVLQALDADDEVAVIVKLADTVNLKKFKDKDKTIRRSKIIKALKNKSAKTQKNIKNYLKMNKVGKVKSFWIFNGLALTTNAEIIEELAAMDGTKSISLDVALSRSKPPVSKNAIQPEWNINAINAPELWDRGYTGKNTVLAIMDTGVDVNHPDLASSYRGGSNSWYDPNLEHTMPHDSDGHGTGVMGVMVGGNAGGSAIGVAPGAQWIAVKIFNDAGGSTYGAIHSGYQWLLDPDGNDETDDAPDVINNSWGFNTLPDTCLTEFQPDIQVLKASGIGMVFSAGNGNITFNPPTSESPANYLQSFAVGGVDATLDIHFKSSRGPSACGGGIYPEMVAPGVNVLTTDLGNSYASVTGTSIAAPHVAGAMGLLLNAYPSLSIEEIETALTATALDLGDIGPDNTYGSGFLDVMAAYNLLSQSQPQAPIANNDRITIPRNTTATINILANDVDPDGTIDETSVVLRSATTVRNATVVVDVGGTVTYTSEDGGGPDYFWYTVKDTEGTTSNEARVRVNRVRAE